MTVHVLHAGDGYSYLTNQVAVGDQQVRRSEELTDYYTAEGAQPGQWWGDGLASLGVSGQVSAEQMQALFGEGLRPDATAFIQEQIADGVPAADAIAAARLGRRFMTTNDPDTEWQAQVAVAVTAFKKDHQRRPNEHETQKIQAEVAATMLRKSLRRPPAADEVSWFRALRVPDWNEQVGRAYQAFRDEVGRSPETGPERDLVKHNLAADHLQKALGRHASASEVARFLAERGAPARQPVAGYDLVFSPVKSVSLLWALADRDDPREAHIAREVRAAHEAAWQGAMTWLQQEAAFTRTGAGGVAQVETKGLIVAAFEHRDSRTGDPDLHTHVAISTKVEGLDGKWRSLDGRMVHRLGVAASERYNSLVEEQLRNRLGVQFVDESRGANKRVVREIMGVSPDMRDGFSGRRASIEQAYSELVNEYVEAHGHVPPKNIQHRLYERANLATRESKAPPSSEKDQVAEWRRTAGNYVTVDGWAAGVVAQSSAMPVQDPIAAASLAQLAAAVVTRVEQDRSTWRDSHLQAEAERVARRVAQATGRDVQTLTAEITEAAIARSITLTPPEANPAPTQLQRANGESVFRVHRAEQYTSEKTLRTEGAILEAAKTTGGFVVDATVFEQAMRDFNASAIADGHHQLNPGQVALARQFATGGHRIEVGIGPAGSGKTTAMRATIYAVNAAGGRVLALGTTGKAAEVLGRELDTATDTADMLVAAHARARRTGDPVSDIHRVDSQTVLLVDEASMAGTPLLGRVLALADEHGASVRLLGDPAQHGAIGAGGVLRLLEQESTCARLSEIHRFAGPHAEAEAKASLQLRSGDVSALDFYVEHGRVFAGTRDEVMDRLYEDWRTDTSAGKSSLMIAGTNEEVTALNARARADRVESGAVQELGVTLADGNTVGVGDVILTRNTDRSLRLNQGKDWVTNNAMWTVTSVGPNGLMAKSHLSGGSVTLPLSYVDEYVQLGYARTSHGTQGDTVSTSGAVIDPERTAREELYVDSTRGKEQNRLYVVIDKPLDAAGHTDDDPMNSVRGALEQVLGRENAVKSATETLRAEQDAAYSLATLLPQYDHARVAALDPAAIQRAEQTVRGSLPASLAERIIEDDAWATFAARLVDHDLAGTNLQSRLQGLVRPIDLDTISPIGSPARVYWWRLGPATTIGTDLEPVEGLPAWITPFNKALGVPEVRTWLVDQQQLMRDRIGALVDDVIADRPAWAEPFGPIPVTQGEADQWRHGIGRIAAYREAFGVPDSEVVLSEEPRGAHVVQAWQDARAAGLELRTLQDRLAREQESAAVLARMGIEPAAAPSNSGTAVLQTVDVDQIVERRPEWLQQYGLEPHGGEARELWRERVATVAAYRTEHEIPAEVLRLPDPGAADRGERKAWEAAEAAHEGLRRTAWVRDRDASERNAIETAMEPASTARAAEADTFEATVAPPQTSAAAARHDEQAQTTRSDDAGYYLRRLTADPAALAERMQEILAQRAGASEPVDPKTPEQPQDASAEVARLAAELRERAVASAERIAAAQRDAAAAQERADQVRRQQEAAERQRQADQRRGPQL